MCNTDVCFEHRDSKIQFVYLSFDSWNEGMMLKSVITWPLHTHPYIIASEYSQSDSPICDGSVTTSEVEVEAQKSMEVCTVVLRDSHSVIAGSLCMDDYTLFLSSRWRF